MGFFEKIKRGLAKTKNALSNTIDSVLSAFGVISALAGSLLHNCGAFVVLINSSRLLKTKYD